MSAIEKTALPASGAASPTECEPRTFPAAQLCLGEVVHERVRPQHHKLRYRVFSVLADVDRLGEAQAACRWFSYNGRNVLSFQDRDFGPRDGTPIAAGARKSFAAAGFVEDDYAAIMLLAYPRLLGYVFNPLSVFYGLDAAGQVKAVIYEVSNTFGERMRYVVAAGDATNSVYAHSCDKGLFVSPFASGQGRYDFRITGPDDGIRVGVAFRDPDGPLIRTHFTAERQALSSTNVRRALVRHPLMTVKVIAAIHAEAFKLWRKGVPLATSHTSPRYSERFDTSHVQV